ncbi:hypothetical protein HOD29_05625 [archaeon]|jgi:hypothetical protein|nr:hypothetical protein [archaeon]
MEKIISGEIYFEILGCVKQLMPLEQRIPFYNLATNFFIDEYALFRRQRLNKKASVENALEMTKKFIECNFKKPVKEKSMIDFFLDEILKYEKKGMGFNHALESAKDSSCKYYVKKLLEED